MTDRQENYLSRAVTVDKALDENAAAFAGVTLLQTLAGSIKLKIAAVNGAAKVQQTAITGAAGDKKNLKMTAIKQVMQLVGPMKAHAMAQNDNEFRMNVNFSVKKLRLMRDTTLGNALVMLNKKANDNLAALADAGVTAPMVAASVTATTNYNRFIANPRAAIATRAAATKQLKTEIELLNGYIRTVKSAIELFKESNTGFYNLMVSAIKVSDN